MKKTFHFWYWEFFGFKGEFCNFKTGIPAVLGTMLFALSDLDMNIVCWTRDT